MCPDQIPLRSLLTPPCLERPTFALPLYTFLLCSPLSGDLLPRLNQTISYIVVWAFTSAIISCTAQGCATYFNPDATQSSISSALALTKASLLLQLAINGAVLCILVVVLITRRKATDDAERNRSARMLVFSLLVLMALLVVRNVFRTIQIFASPLSEAWTIEAYFWVFEGSVMVCYTALFHVLHPAKYVTMGYGCGQTGRCG